jgi:hypothetical protein
MIGADSAENAAKEMTLIQFLFVGADLVVDL